MWYGARIHDLSQVTCVSGSRILDLSQLNFASGARILDLSQVTCVTGSRILDLSQVTCVSGARIRILDLSQVICVTRYNATQRRGATTTTTKIKVSVAKGCKLPLGFYRKNRQLRWLPLAICRKNLKKEPAEKI